MTKTTNNGEFTLDEIAKILGITKERVRQIEAQALKKRKKLCKVCMGKRA